VDSLEALEEAERLKEEELQQKRLSQIQELMIKTAKKELSAEELERLENETAVEMETEFDAVKESMEEGIEEDIDDEQESADDYRDKRVSFESVYQNYDEKAADNKSSAYTLLWIGGIGFIVVVLSFLDIIHLPVNQSSKYMMFGVMGAIFVLFFIMGIISMKNAGKYAKKAVSEKELTKELEKWFVEHVTAEKVDDGLFSEDETDFSEEQKYFKRFDKMKTMLSERFLNLNEGYMNRFVDEHYQDVFSDQQ